MTSMLQEYVDQDQQRRQPIMLHRAIFGSIERFFGILLENYAGAFPLWLAPVQVRECLLLCDCRPSLLRLASPECCTAVSERLPACLRP